MNTCTLMASIKKSDFDVDVAVVTSIEGILAI